MVQGGEQRGSEQKSARTGSGMLEVRSADEGVTRLVTLSGELDLSNVEEVERAFDAALADDCPRIVIDLRELLFIDSTGIALLVSMLRRCGGGERLSIVPSRSGGVRRVMAITGLEGRIPIAEGYPEDPAPRDDGDGRILSS